MQRNLLPSVTGNGFLKKQPMSRLYLHIGQQFDTISLVLVSLVSLNSCIAGLLGKQYPGLEAPRNCCAPVPGAVNSGRYWYPSG